MCCSWFDYIYLYLLGDGSSVQLFHRQHRHQLRRGRFLRTLSWSNGLDLWTETQGQVLWCPCRILLGILLGALAPPHRCHLRIALQQGLHPVGHTWSIFAIIKISIVFGDYITCQPRFGANELFANNLFLNNNLFTGNLKSLMYFPLHAAKTSKFSTANSPKKRSTLSTNVLVPCAPTSPSKTGNGYSILTSRLKKSLNAGENWIWLLPGKTRK